MNPAQIKDLIRNNVNIVSGSGTDLDSLHINVDFDYKKSLSIEASGTISTGDGQYNCEFVLKINKIQEMKNVY